MSRKKRGLSFFCVRQFTQKRLLVSLTVTAPSPGDVAGSLLVGLHVRHGAVPVAERLVSHQVVAAVARLPGLVEVGERRHDVGQRAEVALRRVVVLRETITKQV